MFKKLNYKVLILLLLVLAGIYLISEFGGSGYRTFKSQLVSLDTAKVDRIIIGNPASGKMILIRNTSGWQLEVGGKTYPVEASAMRSLLIPLANMKSEGVAAISEEKHEDLQVNDSGGVHLLAKQEDKTLADLYFGKLSYQQPSTAVAPKAQAMQQYQQQGKMITYVRKGGEETVYAVEGFLRSTYGREVDDYRDKTLVKLNKEDVTHIDFNYTGKGSFSLEKMDDAWMIDGAIADSAKTTSYLQKLGRQRAREFADDFDTREVEPEAIVKIEGNNFSPIILKAYPADTAREYVITSSMNPGAKFSGAKGVYSRIFIDQEKLQK
ncbi:MAG: DUF4340 domain-containing protein [Bacteroidota bacterium]|nr:DUF4340 domain-containing protein [Bacteroidota bacterium]